VIWMDARTQQRGQLQFSESSVPCRDLDGIGDRVLLQHKSISNVIEFESLFFSKAKACSTRPGLDLAVIRRDPRPERPSGHVPRPESPSNPITLQLSEEHPMSLAEENHPSSRTMPSSPAEEEHLLSPPSPEAATPELFLPLKVTTPESSMFASLKSFRDLFRIVCCLNKTHI